jgi:hypothetical protein
MSRRHHGRPHHHAQASVDRPRRVAGMNPDTGSSSHPDQAPQVGPGPMPGPSSTPRPATALPTAAADPFAPRSASLQADRMPLEPAMPPTFSSHDGASSDPTLRPVDGHDATGPGGHIAVNGGPGPINGGHAPTNGGPAPVNGAPGSVHGGAAHLNGGVAPQNGGPDRAGQCTAPQLRRFIKSRPYVPMHELRRRFGIDGGDDDVTSVRLEPGWVYVGLPSREGTLLGDLLRAGEIGYELSLDPRSPIVIGVYPMRPIPRG